MGPHCKVVGVQHLRESLTLPHSASSLPVTRGAQQEEHLDALHIPFHRKLPQQLTVKP